MWHYPRATIIPYATLFSTLKLSSVHQVNFKHPYLTHIKSDSGIFLWIQHVIFFTSTVWIFTRRKFSCLHTLRRFYGVTSFSRHPLVKIIFLKIK
jgi:hypothetical protein